jgi:hypothetical protein
MLLRQGVPNPLNVHNLREVSCSKVPVHFTPVPVSLRRIGNDTKNIKKLKDWIFVNLEGRFCVIHGVSTRAKDEVEFDTTYQFGFEIPTEAMYFTMMMDHITRP